MLAGKFENLVGINGIDPSNLTYEIMSIALSGGAATIDYDKGTTGTYNTEYVHTPKFVLASPDDATECGASIDTDNKHIVLAGEGTSLVTVLIIGYGYDKN